jgi:GTP-binding protein HflX
MPDPGTATRSADPFERPRGGERAVLVHMDLTDHPVPGAAEDPEEFRRLVESAGAEAAATVTGLLRRPDPKSFVPAGKLLEIREAVVQHDAEVVLFDHALSPAQERNLERALECRVIDRTGLILDIFAQRARTFEGRLQVELAQLKYLSTRLVRGWTHLERQKGGIGLRGPGETQLESDRRMLRVRVKVLLRRLEKVRSQRDQGRRARRRAQLPAVSLVGYTNAGKSSLFNRLTGGDVYTADQLFATLDPTLRRLDLPELGGVVLADTVGFIRHLPHDLVAAFQATLEETREANLLLHVVDASAEDRDLEAAQVQRVLHEIGAEHVPQLEVYNKIDALEHAAPALERDANGVPQRVWLSARSGSGVDLLLQALGERLRQDLVHGWIRLPPAAGRLRAKLFELGGVRAEQITEDGSWLVEVQLARQRVRQLAQRVEFGEALSPLFG